jgi:histidine ammonia-lyase
MAAYRTIRQHVPFLEKDRLIADDIATVRALIHSGDILHAVEKAVGTLH